MTLSLRLATIDDTTVLIDIAEKLFKHSAYATISAFDRESVETSMRKVLEGDQSQATIVLLLDGYEVVGAIAVAIVPQLFNFNHKTAAELLYWIEPEYRTGASQKKLLKAYRYWAKKVGCHSILMGKLKNKNEVETYTIRRL